MTRNPSSDGRWNPWAAIARKIKAILGRRALKSAPVGTFDPAAFKAAREALRAAEANGTATMEHIMAVIRSLGYPRGQSGA